MDIYQTFDALLLMVERELDAGTLRERSVQGETRGKFVLYVVW